MLRCIVILYLFYPFASMAQQVTVPERDTQYPRLYTMNPRYSYSHDSVWVRSGICKTLKTSLLTGQSARQFLRSGNLYTPPFLKVKGNIQYDFTYRSLVDTPFAQKDFRQHSVQTSMNFIIKDRYPLRMTVLSRRSNSPYFDNITDVNIQFDRGMFLQQVKTQLNNNILEQAVKNKPYALEDLYERKKKEVQSLQDWLSHPARVQEIVQFSEAAISRNRGLPVPGNNAVTAPGQSLPPAHRVKKQAFDKAVKELKAYEDRLKKARGAIQDSVNKLQQQLAKATNPEQLRKFIAENKNAAKNLPAGWKTLSQINHIGIGRSWVDYTPLTVKNISLTGLNVEINPSKIYLAFAAGKVNYRFRDFVVRNHEQSKQSLYLLRAGIGRKEGNNLIFTWYDGKRNLLSNAGNTLQAQVPERVMGASVQVRFQMDENHYAVIESAKSSFHNTGTVNGSRGQLAEKIWNFRNRTNEAISLDIYNYWSRSNTKLTAFYRKAGENFQSFNLQPVNVVQEAYQLKLQQYLWKRKLSIEGGVRKNDFSNPLIYPGISSKTVFKSLQVAVRVPRYPFLSVGYFPSSQLTVLDNNIIAENQYQVFSAVASHTWRLKKAGMNTNMTFLKFFNNSTDTGFIYYNAGSWTINHTFFLDKLQLQGGFTITRQHQLEVVTLEQSVNWQMDKWLTLSGGLKHNRVNGQQTLWGGTAGLAVQLEKMGTVQASYDKSYLPGTARNLLPVDMGRITFYRTF